MAAGIGDAFWDAAGFDAAVRQSARGMERAFEAPLQNIGRLALRSFDVDAAQRFGKAVTAAGQASGRLKGGLESLGQVAGQSLGLLRATFDGLLQGFVNGLTLTLRAVNSLLAGLLGLSGGGKSLAALGTAAAKAGSSAARGGKQAKGALAAFDELNNLQSGTSGGGSLAGGLAEIGSALKALDFDGLLAQLLKRPFAFGKTLGEKLNAALHSIDWGRIQSTLAAAAATLALLLNGLVDGIDWPLLGYSLAQGLNTLLLTVFTFVKTFDFGAYGGAVAAGLSSAVATVDWELLGRALASKWTMAIDFLYRFVTGFDWRGLGAGLADAVNGWFAEIDWAKLGATLSEGVRGVLALVLAFLATLDWQQIGIALTEFLLAIDWAGVAGDVAAVLSSAFAGASTVAAQLIGGLWAAFCEDTKAKWSGLGGHLGSVTAGLAESLMARFGALRDGVCAIFAALGATALELWGGLKDGLAAVAGNICAGFTDSFSAMKSTVVGIFEGLKSGIRGAINGILGGVEGMANGVVGGINQMIGALNNLRFDLPDWLPGIGGKSFGLAIPQLATVTIPKLAKGGIIDQPTLAMVGEAGKEAVVPLENNTGWMVSLANLLADAIAAKQAMQQDAGAQSGGAGSLTLEIDGREFGEIVLDHILQAAGRRGIPLAVQG